MAEISSEQHRINRINELFDRLDKIPGELDAIHEKLYAGNMAVSYTHLLSWKCYKHD